MSKKKNVITSVRSLTDDEVLAFPQGGVSRVLGRTLPTRTFSFTPFVQAPGVPPIDLSLIPPYDQWQKNIPILDQGQIGSCTAHGLATALMKARDLAGYQYLPLGPTSLYAQINRGVDRGSNPSDGVEALQQNGICLLSDVPDVFVSWDSIPRSAKETAKRFRISESGVYRLDNFAELVTADYLGFGTVITVMVGSNFNPGPSGLVGYTPGPGNHCVAGGEGFKIINGQPAYRFRNSWTSRWGVNGCGWLTARYIDNQPQREMFAIKWPLSDPLDPDNPPSGA